MTARRLGAALACFAGLAAVILVLSNLDRADSTPGDGGTERGTLSRDRGGEAAARPTPLEERLQDALRSGVEQAAAEGGQVEAAAMLDGSPVPLVATSSGGGAERYMRMWSISKVATTVTLLRLLGWEERPGEMPSLEVREALVGALTRSENCRQRRVVLELQWAAGGIPQTRRALTETFALAGAEVRPGSQIAAPEALCVPFLEEQVEIPEPLAVALLLGTSRWRVTDAVRLAHALAVERYGKAVSDLVFELMEGQKRPSREGEEGELTAPLDWGAGKVFDGFAPAYKAGWGGTLNGNFLAAQIVVVPLRAGDHLALAVVFHPDRQPIRDDPGITTAPEALEIVMESVRSSIEPFGIPERNESGSASVSGSD